MAAITTLTSQQCKEAENLFKLLERFSALSLPDRQAVYARFEQLRVFTPGLTRVFEENIKRINK